MNRLGLRLASGTPLRASRSVSRCSLVWSRGIHVRKELSYPIENGLGDFLSPESLRMIAVDYHEGLLERLNQQVKGTEQENKSVAQTIIDTSVDPDKALAFGYASEALNNSFFLESVKPPAENASSHEDKISSLLRQSIRFDFGTLEQLKSTFSATALGMFSSGWVWLVCDQTGALAVVPTFGTGTLLFRAKQRVDNRKGVVVGSVLRNAEDQNSEPPETEAAAAHTSSPSPAPSSPTSGISHTLPPLHPSTPSRTFTRSSVASAFSTPKSLHDDSPENNHTTARQSGKAQDILRIGQNLYPLMCLSIHEHAWVSAGYGVWGKEEYLKRFWSVVNWAVVSQSYDHFCPESRRTFRI